MLKATHQQVSGSLSPEQKVEHHDIASTFPRMSDAESLALKIDINAHGLNEPIVLFQGKVLDGRERLDACRELGLDVPFENFVGTVDEARDFFLSKNLIRTQMNSSQRAMAAVNHYVQRNHSGTGYTTHHGTIEATAEATGSNRAGLYKAARIKHVTGPDLSQEILDGKVSLTAAEKRLARKERGEE